MAKTGKARVLGSSAIIVLEYSKEGGTGEVQIGEVDKFSAKESGELKKSRPLGKTQFASQYDCQGYELSFDGGKVDWNLAALFSAQSLQVSNNGRSPYFSVVQTIKYYNGNIEQYRYDDVTIYDYNLDVNGSGDEITEKFTGFAASRTPIDTGTIAKHNGFSGIFKDILDKMAPTQSPGNDSLLNSSNV